MRAVRAYSVLQRRASPTLYPYRSFTFSGPHDQPPPGLYRHYESGEVYKVWGNVLHTETSEVMVLYHAIHPSKKAVERNPHGMAFVRPRDMFMETVVHNGTQVPRFQPLIHPFPFVE